MDYELMKESNNNNVSEKSRSNGELPGWIQTNGDLHKMANLSGMYQDWFLDYASYVILGGLCLIFTMD
jgi:hypothetical protein